MSTIKKAIVGLVGAVLTWGLTAHLPDGSIDRAEWWGLAVAVATALGVYATPNGPQQVEIVGEPVVVDDVDHGGEVKG